MKIRWTEEALEDANEIIEYLQERWSAKSADLFRSKLISKIELLSLHPFIGKSSDRNPEIRKLVLTKQTSLYYRIVDNTVELLSLFSNKQEKPPH
ncbi:type II toxin-antitoxin system RelE/ParE family toxin [Marinoscillum furvescens]|uniref:Plasmid stabilization system protein ParE n=1 Tax=Marinoscillum furvescens DSM 4134 TaxID=1122208 RepID=A0A3D9L859_MARFU|nr:type II toxin-antitoxin system RelE/ParE family toxin [Marinoscillum furvescens]REE01057.1 plasmid stabilization system protein ParE [Marinoscillum furvescens DSM 4134]